MIVYVIKCPVLVGDQHLAFKRPSLYGKHHFVATPMTVPSFQTGSWSRGSGSTVGQTQLLSHLLAPTPGSRRTENSYSPQKSPAVSTKSPELVNVASLLLWIRIHQREKKRLWYYTTAAVSTHQHRVRKRAITCKKGGEAPACRRTLHLFSRWSYRQGR